MSLMTEEAITNFIDWLKEEMDKRQWSQADLANRAGITDASLSHILNRNRKPGPDVCRGIAQAFGEPPEKVFRLAGILPDEVGEQNGLSDYAKELVGWVEQLPEDQKEFVLETVKALVVRRATKKQ